MPAGYYDGRTSTRRDALVDVRQGWVTVSADGVDRRELLGVVEIAQGLGSTPTLVRFADGAYCELESASGFGRLLAAQGVGPGRVSQWEGSPRWLAAAIVLFVLALAAAYRYGIPVLARIAANRVPDVVGRTIGQRVLTAIDGQILLPSITPRDRQQRITDRFHRLRLPAPGDASTYQIVFRRSELLGPNAMALPSGTVIVTDQLLELSDVDDEVIAVLAHEAGHVEGRHGLRALFQSSIVALAATWFLGDVNVLIATAPTTLLQAKYSRDLEREADDHAVAVLMLNGIPTRRLVRMLERLDEPGGKRASASGGIAERYLSTHPVTAERVARLRGMR